jgi:hypothetical protein
MANLVSTTVTGILNVSSTLGVVGNTNFGNINTVNMIDVANGTPTAPSYGFIYSGSQFLGLYLAANNVLGVVANGNVVMNIAQTSINISSPTIMNVAQNLVSGNISVNGNITFTSGGTSFDTAAPMGVAVALTMRLMPSMGMPIF